VRFRIPQIEFLTKQIGDVYRVERGGEVTYHCPGTLVQYPILNLQHYRKDSVLVSAAAGEVRIRVLAVCRVEGRSPRLTGLPRVDCVAADRHQGQPLITMHGFALNVCPDFTGFERIAALGGFDAGWWFG